MAKDKEFEKRYKEIRIERAYFRRRERNKTHWQNKRDRGEECPYCGGVMSWCSTCQMWSKVCCSEYGTCACS